MKDPRRTFNQDETPLSPGVEYQRVLTEKGWDCPVHNQGGDARLHIDEQMVIIFEIAPMVRLRGMEYVKYAHFLAIVE